jgi:hypothetical protein
MSDALALFYQRSTIEEPSTATIDALTAINPASKRFISGQGPIMAQSSGDDARVTSELE